MMTMMQTLRILAISINRKMIPRSVKASKIFCPKACLSRYTEKGFSVTITIGCTTVCGTSGVFAPFIGKYEPRPKHPQDPFLEIDKRGEVVFLQDCFSVLCNHGGVRDHGVHGSPFAEGLRIRKMFYSKEKSIRIAEVDGEEVRKSTIDRIEKITLQMIVEISSKNFPKLTYHEFNPKEGRTELKKTPDQPFRETPTTSNVVLHGNLEDCQPIASTSFDSSKSLSWVCENEEAQNDDVYPVIAEEGAAVGVEEAAKFQSAGSSTTVDFRRKRSRKNLVLIVTVMSHVHKMLINGTTKTRRSLYYELQSKPTAGLAKTQRVLDDAVNHVASLLERAPWELGFIATSKGLVFGDLDLKFSTCENSVSCRVPGGLLIPQNIFSVIEVRTRARYVVVVEKDSIFQKLLDEDCADYLNCILITGKGYPDINTRMLVRLLGNRLKIPVYVLVDADPFGFEIMCIYRFGSALRSREQEDLVCPIVRWIGIHPSEYSALGISASILSTADKGRLSSLEGRNYVDENESLSKELQILKMKGKVEIEAVANLSYRFLTSVYLPHKISAKNFV